MITCKRCNAQLPDETYTCPHCGYALSEETNKKILYFVYGSFTFALISGIVGFFVIQWLAFFGLAFSLTGISQSRRILKGNPKIFWGFIGCIISGLICLAACLYFLIIEVKLFG